MSSTELVEPQSPLAETDPSGPHLGRYPVRLPRASDPRLHLATVTTTLQVLGQTVFGFDLSIAQILISIGTCALIELVVVFSRTRVIAWPASAMLTGNGIALILRVPGTEHGDWWSLHGWWIFAGTAAFAMGTKYLVRVKGRHVFNPSNVALVAAFVLLGEARADPQILWWGPLSPGLVLAFVVICAGSIAITRRVGQGPTALSFWLVFAAGAGIVAASGHEITASWHVGPISGWSYWWLVVTSPEVLVFLFFMITDPKTSPSGRVGRALFGCGVALVSALLIATQGDEFGTKVGILAGLVVLCLFVRVIDRRTPAPGQEADRIGPWLRQQFGSGEPAAGEHGRRVGLLLVAVLVGTAVLLGVLGSRSSAGDRSVNLDRRGEVAFEPASLPAVGIDADRPPSSLQLTPEMARAMAVDLGHALAIERAALERSDADLAAAGSAGVRLAQVVAAIDAEAPAPPERTFTAVTATMVRLDPGPQTPPQLALRTEGRQEGPEGPEPFQATYLLEPVGGVHLIVNELDADGRPVGDQRAGTSSIEPAIEPEPLEPSPQQLAGLELVDVTAEAGLDVRRSAVPLREGPAAMSAGVAVGDVDGDGLPDLYLTRVGEPNVLYRNTGDGRFVDVTAAAGLGGQDPTQSSSAASFVDLDGDGHLDLVVLGLGSTPHRVHLGDGTGRFVEAGPSWQIPVRSRPGPDAASFAVAAADYDGDGRVDLLVAEADPYPVVRALEQEGVDPGDPCADRARAAVAAAARVPSNTVLLRNTGSGLEDRTADLGIDPGRVVPMDAHIVDLDGDGAADIVLTGHLCTTTVLAGQGDGTFADVTAQLGVDLPETASGSVFFDADGDGRLDWFVSGLSYPTASGACPVADVALGCSGNRLLLNDGSWQWRDATDQHGVRDATWGWGAAAGDLTGDGRADLVLAGGHRNVASERADTRADGPVHERYARGSARLWLNSGPGPWPDATASTGLDDALSTKAIRLLDVDGDGRLDLLLVPADEAPRLLQNRAAQGE